MIRYTLLFCLFAMTLMTTAATDARADSGPREFYEIRSYVLNEGASAEAIDGYLKEALIPALQRHGAGPVGVFSNSENDETGSTRVIVAIPFDNAAAAAEAQQELKSDSVYQQAAEQHMSLARTEIPYRRVESELLVAMQCMPQLKVPSKMMDNEDRVYELRIYESGNERLGNLKVDMFNDGEVPIFLDSGIQPVFIGQAVVGPFTPNLTYLTVYPNEEARNQAWQNFRTHPDWKVLSKVPKYQGTVSKIHKYVLTPKSYSQM